jgi:hypothetical protein
MRCPSSILSAAILGTNFETSLEWKEELQMVLEALCLVFLSIYSTRILGRKLLN